MELYNSDLTPSDQCTYNIFELLYPLAHYFDSFSIKSELNTFHCLLIVGMLESQVVDVSTPNRPVLCKHRRFWVICVHVLDGNLCNNYSFRCII